VGKSKLENAARSEGLGLGNHGKGDSLHYMNHHLEILRYLSAQATAAAFIPIILLAFNKLTMPQTAHKQRELREKVIALNVFIGSMNERGEAGITGDSVILASPMFPPSHVAHQHTFQSFAARARTRIYMMVCVLMSGYGRLSLAHRSGDSLNNR
jgi:hypothetical protein